LKGQGFNATARRSPTHRCRSKRIFWGAKHFAQIFPNLAKKFPCKFCRPFFGVISKKWSLLVFLQMLCAIFEVKQCWAPFLPRFSGISPRHLGILFGFSGILPKFSEILPQFSTNQNFWAGACTPCTPTSYTTAPTSLFAAISSHCLVTLPAKMSAIKSHMRQNGI